MSGIANPYSVGLVAALSLAAGMRMTFFTRTDLERAEAGHARRLADRMARGSDRYLDELRSLEAYRPIVGLRRRRWIGIALLILTIALITLYMFVTE